MLSLFATHATFMLDTLYLAVKSDLSIVPHDDRHPLAHVVEVEDAEQLMHLLHPQRLGQIQQLFRADDPLDPVRFGRLDPGETPVVSAAVDLLILKNPCEIQLFLL